MLLLTIFTLFSAFSVEDVSFMWAACVSKVPSIAAKEVRRKKLMSGTHQFKGFQLTPPDIRGLLTYNPKYI